MTTKKKILKKTPKIDCFGIKCTECIFFKHQVERKGKIYEAECKIVKAIKRNEK